MITLIDENREAIEALCRAYAVARLEVFGSAVRGKFDPARSDVDFLVEFRKSPTMDAVDQYFGLLEDLQALLDRRIDLVCVKALRNPFFVRSVNATKELLYAA